MLAFVVRRLLLTLPIVWIVVTIALTYILVNLTTDVLYSVVDPRIRYD